MPAVPQVTKTGPRTFVPAVGQFISGGQLVEATTGGRVRVAQAASVRVLGVALTDAVAPEDLATALAADPTIVQNTPVVNMNPKPQNLAVAYGGIEVPVVYSAAAAFGDLLVATANGQVAPAGATPDARTIVGRCTAPAGVSGAGVVGLMRTL
jgi:hypothetical protein